MHIPVLLNETIDGLAIKEGGIYVDCTTNRGGHSVKIAKALKGNGTLICIDLDKDALKEAEQLITSYKVLPTLHFVHSNFRYLPSILKELGITHVVGILADIGISS